MSNGKASIFYGLFDRAVDLIELRKNKGTLKLEKGVRAGFTALPIELVEAIVEKTVAILWVEAEDDFIHDFHAWHECGEDECEAEYNVALSVAHFDECEVCGDWLYGDRGMMELLSSKQRKKEIEVLLSSFGLRLPSFEPVLFEEFPPISTLVSPLTILLAQPSSANLEPQGQADEKQDGKKQKEPQDKAVDKKKREESKKPGWHLWTDGSAMSW
ncbi:hypothetical protein JCM8547_002314 [Rhodosporidiobolus lusitaniae]